MEGNNTAPFKKGQRVVALFDGNTLVNGKVLLLFKKGDEFTVRELWFCCMWRIDIGLKHPSPTALCQYCQKKNGQTLWVDNRMLAPIERRSIEISKEVLDSFPKITEERADVKPQTVNN